LRYTPEGHAVQVLEGFQRQAGVLLAGRLHELAQYQTCLQVLGYDFRHVQIDPKSQADALQGGSIVGAAAYTTSGASLAPYWKETEIRLDVTVVNPCPTR